MSVPGWVEPSVWIWCYVQRAYETSRAAHSSSKQRYDQCPGWNQRQSRPNSRWWQRWTIIPGTLTDNLYRVQATPATDTAPGFAACSADVQEEQSKLDNLYILFGDYARLITPRTGHYSTDSLALTPHFCFAVDAHTPVGIDRKTHF